MALSEFDIIARYFQRSGLAPAPAAGRVDLGIGDDCALISVGDGESVALTMDLLVEKVHFPAAADPRLIAAKCLAVNLSDLAAMGAAPVGFTLGLTLSSAGEDWLEGFSQGLLEMAQAYACPLIGGDITRGPTLVVAIQAHGAVVAEQALRRAGARPGDLVYVSGTPGDGGAGLELVLGALERAALAPADAAWLEQAYFRPQPRLALGQRLRGLATAAIDVSDGLLADLGHIARSSGVGITIQAPRLPLSGASRRAVGEEKALRHALASGDDYELAFTVPSGRADEVEQAAGELGLACTCIGEVAAGAGVRCLDGRGREMRVGKAGYSHF